ncbi:MAG: hypothetical protein NVSMB2_23100 [Chloroflexota bacterium]
MNRCPPGSPQRAVRAYVKFRSVWLVKDCRLTNKPLLRERSGTDGQESTPHKGERAQYSFLITK